MGRDLTEIGEGFHGFPRVVRVGGGTLIADMKLARVGGGTDEVLWELVAAAMKPDYDGYAEFAGA